MYSYFVILIDPDGTPANLVGPMTYQECVEHILETLKNDPDMEGKPLPDFDTIDLDSVFEYPDDEGGGLYILKAKPKAQ